jgi:hypothetical protein
MSLATFKRKSKATHGSNISGKGNGGYWVSRGPFDPLNTTNNMQLGYSGFSLNGTTRNIGRIGKTYGFSKNVTPFKGIHAKGNGGWIGTYKVAPRTSNVNFVETRGLQYRYVNPSVLSHYGKMQTQYKWIRRPYPFTTVQATGNSITDVLNSSQGMYIEQLASSAITNTDINQSDKYSGQESMMSNNPNYCENNEGNACGIVVPPTKLCNICSNSKRSYNNYCKKIDQPLDASEYMRQLKQGCTNIETLPPRTNGNTLNAINFSVAEEIINQLQEELVN